MPLNSLQVLAYFAIFRYPLTQSEIKKYSSFKSSSRLKSKNNFFTLSKINPINRSARNEISHQKTLFAQKHLKLLKKLPSIKFIGLTGTVAADNAVVKDDIDLLIITSKHTLWLTRFIVNLYLSAKGLRRIPHAIDHQNKLCPNLWLDDSTLTLPPSYQNLYSAFELTLIKPLFQKNQTHQRLLFANRSLLKQHFSSFPISLPTNPTSSSILAFIIYPLNYLFYLLQYLYMFPKKTIEIISLHQAFFHPQNLSFKFLKKYHQICKQHHIKTN